MCARYTLTSDKEVLEAVFGITLDEPDGPRTNIAPTQQVLGVVEDDDGQRLAWHFRWGLVPFWAKSVDEAPTLINARSETAADKRTFSKAFRTRRLLVPMDGFYEWRGDKGDKQPFHVRRCDRRPFAVAGLFRKYEPDDEDGRKVSCTVLTGKPNALVKQLHDRSPVVLPEEHWDRWLDRDFDDVDALEAMLEPFDPEGWEAVPVNKKVGNPKNHGMDLLEPQGDALTA